MMKATSLKIFLALSLAGLLLTGCKKEGIDFFRGVYGFKTSGALQCVTVGETPSPFVFPLLMEQGTMHCEPIGKDNAMVVTFNALGGNVVVFDADVQGNEITLKPVKRIVSITYELPKMFPIISDSEIITPVAKEIGVTVSGNGTKYNGLIVFNLTYAGDDFEISTQYGTMKFSIAGSRVESVAAIQ